MNQDKIRKILQKELMEINLMNVEQSERAQLTYTALEQYRQAGNKLRRAEEQAEQKRVQGIMGQFKEKKEARDLEANKEILKTVAGTELFDTFVKKYVKEKK